MKFSLRFNNTAYPTPGPSPRHQGGEKSSIVLR